MPPENDLCCPFQQEIISYGHPYLQRCSKAPHDDGLHYLRPAHHIAWEIDHKVFMPGMMRMFPLGLYMRPWDEDWRNLEPQNWEVTTREKINAASARPRSGQQFTSGWKKCCVTCDEWKPDDDFERNRNECKECFKERLKRNVAARKEHATEFGCVLVGETHYHLGKLGSGTNPLVVDYWLALRFDALRKDGPSRVKREVERLQQLVEDDNDARRHKATTPRPRTKRG